MKVCRPVGRRERGSIPRTRSGCRLPSESRDPATYFVCQAAGATLVYLSGLHVRVNSQPASGKLPLSLYVCTQTLYFSSVRHCLANCLCYCTSVHRHCTSFSVQHCLANCLSHCTSVHRPCTSPQSGSCVLVCGLRFNTDMKRL